MSPSTILHQQRQSHGDAPALFQKSGKKTKILIRCVATRKVDFIDRFLQGDAPYGYSFEVKMATFPRSQYKAHREYPYRFEWGDKCGLSLAVPSSELANQQPGRSPIISRNLAEISQPFLLA